jgi:hypothetical protein
MDTFGELDWTTYTTASLTGEDFGENLNSNLFSLELEKVFWNNQLHNSIQSQLDVCWIHIAEWLLLNKSELLYSHQRGKTF